MLSTQWIFIFLISYVTITLIISYVISKTQANISETYGKKASLTTFIVGFTTSWYGAIVASGELYYNYGVSAWFVYGLSYHLCIIFIAIFFVRKIYYAPAWSLSEFILRKYDFKTAYIINIIICIKHSAAVYIIMICELMKNIFEVPYYISFISIILYQIAIMYKGFQIIKTIQYLDFMLMFGGFSLIFYQCLCHPINMKAALPQEYFTAFGLMNTQKAISWYFIAIISLSSPYLYHAIKSAKSYIIAQKGLIIAVILLVFFDYMAGFTGIYTRAIFPDIPASQTYFVIGQYFLTPVTWGIFTIAIVSIIMSALTSHFFITTKMLERDILLIKKYNKITAIIINIAFTGSMVLLNHSITAIIYNVGSIFSPSIAILILYALIVKKPINGSFICTVSICAASITKLKFYFVSFEPAISGLIFALLAALIGLIYNMYISRKNMLV